MLKRIRSAALALALTLSCAACAPAAQAAEGETLVRLSDSAVTVDGKAASTDATSAVSVGAAIVYYEEGKDASYGEGTEADAHSAAEAAAHTVVTITQPGTYRVTGSLSAGQLAVDLGEGAESDPDAVVTLILDNADITCTVAPAVIFYRVYECGSADAASATATVDTADAGANVVIADGSVNNISGSYVAKIYKDGTDKKLHKYDGAFYSKMSMNVDGGTAGDGVLNLTAENEGLDAELHLTINGGVIHITAQNDGINTNEDGVSVTTVNGGTLTIDAGLGAEGDGIDSNGFLVINGGTVTTMANPRSGDGGLDSDGGIYLNGGTVVALGSRNDDIETASTQSYMELTFASTVSSGSTVEVRGADGGAVLSFTADKDFQSAVVSSPDLALNEACTLYVDGVQQQYTGNRSGMMGGGFGGGTPPDGAEGMTPPDGTQPPEDGQNGEPPTLPDGTQPDGERPERPEGTEGMTPPDGTERPDGGRGGAAAGTDSGTASTDFTLTASAKRFSGVADAALPFTDLTSGTAVYDAVSKLYALGVMNGTGSDTFSPEESVSRAMAVTVLARLAGAGTAESSAFSDVDSGSWYGGYVGWAVENGLVQGDGEGHFLPDSTVTGEQMELILTRYAAWKGISYTAAGASSAALTRGGLAELLVQLL